MFVVCVNDASVMDAWKTNQGLAGSDLIDFVEDEVDVVAALHVPAS